MQKVTPELWHNALYFLPIVGGVVEAQKAPVESMGFVGCALAAAGVIWIAGNTWLVVMEETRRNAPYTSEPTLEEQMRLRNDPKPEPVILENGLRPIIKVDGKPRVAYAYTAQAMKINKEREFYVILWRWHESGREINLTEAYWLKQRKQFKRSEFVDVKARGEAGGILYRLSAAKNAPHDVHDWEAVERVARGGALPR